MYFGNMSSWLLKQKTSKNMKIKSLLLLIFAPLMFCCNSRVNNESVEIKDSEYIGLPIETMCVLRENLFVIGGLPSDLAFFKDSSFLLSVGRDLVLYDKEGSQMKRFGQYGEGPGEYMLPEKLCITSKYVYVWCKESLKLLMYDLDGNFVNEYRYFKHAIQNFVVWEDKYVCFLLNGDIEDKRIDVYEIEKNRSVWAAYHKNNVDDIFSVSSFSGGITIVDNKLYWCYPSSICLYEYDLETACPDRKEMKSYSYMDTQFSVDIKNAPPKEELNRDPRKIFNFIRNNSRTTQMFNMNNHPAIFAEIGKSEIINETLSRENRKIKYYSFTDNGKFVKSYVFDYPRDCGLIKGVNDDIYFLTGKYEGDSLNAKLMKMIF